MSFAAKLSDVWELDTSSSRMQSEGNRWCLSESAYPTF